MVKILSSLHSVINKQISKNTLLYITISYCITIFQHFPHLLSNTCYSIYFKPYKRKHDSVTNDSLNGIPCLVWGPNVLKCRLRYNLTIIHLWSIRFKAAPNYYSEGRRQGPTEGCVTAVSWELSEARGKPLWKTFCQFRKTLNIELPHDPANPM